MSLNVAIVGVTGAVGQEFLKVLQQRCFPATGYRFLASARSAGKEIDFDGQIYTVEELTENSFKDMDLALFSAGGSISKKFAPIASQAGCIVVDNSSAFRMDPNVPLVIPEVNPAHLELARRSPHAPGAIVTNPNCSTIGLVLALKPLADAFGIKKVSVVTMQAISGAGLPGVAGYEIADNVVPYIPGEEDKMQAETRKILGDDELILSAQCNRVPVLDGHLQCVAVELDRKADETAVRDAWERFEAEPQKLGLPSAPKRPIHYLEGCAAPQPRLHRDLDKGMAASIGRLRPCPLFDYKFVTLSHNTVRGAAGGTLLLAELAVARGLLETTPT